STGSSRCSGSISRRRRSRRARCACSSSRTRRIIAVLAARRTTQTSTRRQGAELHMRPLRILTWHVHGSYLYYLTQSAHQFYLPVTPERGEGYGGRTPSFERPDNVQEVAAEVG